FEYRQTRTTSHSDLMYGYDEATQTNLNIMTDWAYVNNPTTGVFGDHYVQGMAPKTFSTSDLLHRYYSVYFNANYIYDSRYAVSGSYRIDKCDLFGTDPKFRGRPLWSVGGSWNAHNEQFLRDVTWLNAFKPRFSYGLTGNIDSSVSSYLVAKMSINSFTGDKLGSLVSPPNDQLRWEKTATFNAGFDFALFGYRLNGSVDFYNKRSSDVLTVTDLDATTGWSSLTINSGKVRNRGVEIQLYGRIVRPNSRNDFGFDLGFNLAFNKNKVLKLSHYPQSGAEQLSFTLHEGYPLNSIFSFDFAGFVEDNGQYYMGWRDKEGEVHTSSIGNSDFKIEDAVYCGSATPTVTASLTPQLTWRGFTLSAMMAFYGGHYMRAGEEEWYVGGSSGGYYTTWGMGGDVPVSAFKYWEGDASRPANGAFYYSTYNYMSYAKYRNTNVHHADYLKVRNIVLSYNFDKKICRKIGMNDLRLRFQINNLATWARNGLGLDPEAVSGGYNINKAPRSYTMSLYFSL
ncbi:MAG: TonB-dependent receptor, partial [Duncaniella sp.]|nr:TonB-dependent receptor [Duncaniella sp.]